MQWDEAAGGIQYILENIASNFDENKIKMSIKYRDSSVNISFMSSYVNFSDSRTDNFLRLILEKEF